MQSYPNPKHERNLALSMFVLVLCTQIISFFSKPIERIIVINSPEDIYVPHEFRMVDEINVSDFKKLSKKFDISPYITSCYQDPDMRKDVLAFFEELTENYDVAYSILEECFANDVSISLAFALAYEESGFEPKAVHYNKQSVDRGIFQLNSKSFPKLTESDFFNIRINVHNGIKHLKFCLKEGGNDINALAVYNAGLGRVERGGTPQQTLSYINRILENRDIIESLFEAKVMAKNSGTSAVAVTNYKLRQLD